MTNRIIILGALSEIAEAAARRFAARGARFVLAGRTQADLESLAADLRVRGAAEVHIAMLDLAEGDPNLLETWAGQLGGVDLVLLAYGELGRQPDLAAAPAEARAFIDRNFGSAAAWCLATANLIEAQGAGRLIVIGSVAGDRGRQSNYIYGSTKAGLGVLVEGISHRLARSGASAILIKPGLVDTAMTAEFAKSGPLWSKPVKIAEAIERAARGRRTTAYAPGYWRAVMSIIKALPTTILHRTRL